MLTTDHCITGSLRHIYEFYGYHISEDMLLGLGAGLGFSYWHIKGVPPIFGGRANFERPGEKGLEKIVGERTGVQVESYYTLSRKKAEAALIALLNAGKPVMVYVDMGFLPYFDLPEGYHFGGHAVVVAGYDAAAGQTLIADRDGVLHLVSLEALEKARSSTFKPFPPRHAWYTFDFTHRHPISVDAVRQAISEVVAFMIEPPMANFGVKGIRTAAKRVCHWPQIMADHQVREACETVHYYIHADGGTGGGIFRYMYSRFLREAGFIADDVRLVQSAAELRAIGDQWQHIDSLFIEAAKAPDLLPKLQEATTAMLSVADCEQQLWETLQGVISG